ncbi:MAG: cytochrome c [Leptolyngbya sp. PLA3]|nr:MAG: cytochrome c [Cyanobacteria bacterium CYA]MCE7967968.1 cytochrome c [Leptolyngbya sp. PL-A3]
MVIMPTRFPVVLIGLIALLAGPPACGEKPTAPAAPRQSSPEKGRLLFIQVCTQCHGADARGVDFLGADLKASAFFNQSDEQAVIDLIVRGKPATADRPAMPPRGGRLSMTEDDIRDIIAYIDSLPGPSVPQAPPAEASPTTAP